MISLVGERLTGVADDVRFYFVEAAGEMGVKSAWNVPENPYKPIRRPKVLTCGPVFVKTPARSPRTYELQGTQAARRYARIQAAMARLDPRSRDMLRDAYADTRPTLAREVFGELAQLAEGTRAAGQAHRGAKSKAPLGSWLDSLCQRVSSALRNAKRPVPLDWELVKKIREEATHALLRAEAEYLRAKGATRGK